MKSKARSVWGDLIHVDVIWILTKLNNWPPVIKALRKYTKLPFDVHL